MNIIRVAAAAFTIVSFSVEAETFEKVRKVVRDRAGAEVHWEKHMAACRETGTIVARLLREPLTVASAVQIALVNNRALQATFGEIGIAQADIIEAVTIPNPSVDFEVELERAVGGTLTPRQSAQPFTSSKTAAKSTQKEKKR